MMNAKRTINISCKTAINLQAIRDLYVSILKQNRPERFKAKHYGSGKFYKYSEKKFIEAFDNEMNVLDDNIRFSVEWDGGRSDIIKYVTDIALRIRINMDAGPEAGIYNELEEFIIENAIMASEADVHDMNAQNERLIHMLEMMGENPDNYPKCKGTFEDVEIDIEKNPGFWRVTRGFDFAAFYRMWFGKEAYDIYDKEALRTFPCYENVVLDNDVTRITLYENILDYNKKENRAKQWEFREKLHVDEIGRRMQEEENEEKMKKSDPEISIIQGSFEHGGVRLIRTYLKDGKNVPRSKADTVEEVEMDDNGKEVYRCTRELPD